MKLDADITILGSEHGVTIEINDRDANSTICEIELSTKDFVSAAMGRLAHVRCTASVPCPERIGKQHEHKDLIFEMPECSYKDRTDTAIKEAEKSCPEGWFFSKYFGSQGSFWSVDHKNYAKTTIRRYVDKEQNRE